MNDADFADLPPTLRPTAAELEMGLEAAGVRPRRGLTAEIDALERRIDLLEDQAAAIRTNHKANLISDTTAANTLAGIAADLAAARTRLADCRRQQPAQN